MRSPPHKRTAACQPPLMFIRCQASERPQDTAATAHPQGSVRLRIAARPA